MGFSAASAELRHSRNVPGESQGQYRAADVSIACKSACYGVDDFRLAAAGWEESAMIGRRCLVQLLTVSRVWPQRGQRTSCPVAGSGGWSRFARNARLTPHASHRTNGLAER